MTVTTIEELLAALGPTSREISVAHAFRGPNYRTGIIRFEVQAVPSAKSITHADQGIIAQVLAGTGTLRLGAEQVPLEPGALCHIPAGTPHDFRAGAEPLTLLFIQIQTRGRRRMVSEKTALLTAGELFRLPDDGKRRELVKGELRTMPPAGGEHGSIALEAAAMIRNHVRAHRLGHVFAAETGFVIARHPDIVRAPDVAFVAAGRFPNDRPPATFPELAPDLVVEVVSPSDAAREVEEKVLDWLRAGVRVVLVVYPSTRSVAIYRSLMEIRVVTESDVLDLGDVLPGFTCPVQDLFPA